MEKNFGRWHQIIGRIMSTPECIDLVRDGEFYTLTNPKTGAQTDFGICERCFLGVVESSGHGNGHTMDRGGMWRKTRPPGPARCDLNPGAARCKKLMAKYAEMVLTGSESVLVDFVIKMEGVKAYPGSSVMKDHERLWWGTDDFLFCEECYEACGRNTYFGSSFRWQDHRMANSKCDMHSENMRRRYADACQQRTLDAFNQYCQHRNEVWKEAQAMKASQQIANQHNMAMGMSQLVAANNGKHNAAMWGINNVGGDYNNWCDSKYQQAPWQSTQAWNKITTDTFGNATAISSTDARWKEVE